ncbi:MAG: hypothetical protein COA78_01860 [Blastopirellula sp.]|nr:MAG: hypothetical protein COA78_01860 [Blastopirellula sp.]
MNPRNYKTWTKFDDHPIFTDKKYSVSDWSSDPAMYDRPESYSTFLVDWYVHIDPQLPTEHQAKFAKRDIENLIESCAAIEREFGKTKHELFILDDFTVYVSIASSCFKIELYPDNLSDEGHILGLFIDSPEIEDCEHHLADIDQLVPTIINSIKQSNGR